MNSDNCYIGETKRNLKNRIRQHENDIKSEKETTALLIHSKFNHHNFDFKNPSILHFETNKERRNILESLYKNSIKFKTDVEGVNKNLQLYFKKTI